MFMKYNNRLKLLKQRKTNNMQLFNGIEANSHDE